jgi:hypothetical protein
MQIVPEHPSLQVGSQVLIDLMGNSHGRIGVVTHIREDQGQEWIEVRYDVRYGIPGEQSHSFRREFLIVVG